MRVLLFDFGYHTTPHVETEAEIAQRHLDAGDQVLRLTCTGELPVCLPNRQHNLGSCVGCRCRRTAAWQLVSPRVPARTFLNLRETDRQAIAAFSFEGDRLSDLKRLTYGTFDVGLAVASVLVDETKDPDPDLSVHRQFLAIG